MQYLYFDLSSGASGDMILASLLDLGIDPALLNTALQSLDIGHVRVHCTDTHSHFIRAKKLEIDFPGQQPFRHLHTITDTISRSGFSQWVTGRSIDVLTAIAEAESHVHGIALEKVHFHEIGAVDTIVDILGTCLCLEQLGYPQLYFSTLTTGHGQIDTAHGTLAVPAPATVALSRGHALRRLDIEGELLTPTGCALLTVLGTQTQTPPDGCVRGVGYGCGSRSYDHHPNVLRVMQLATEAENDAPFVHQQITVLESDMDHLSGEDLGAVAHQCRERGALDVSWIPLYMKKGRPGYRLSVIAAPHDAQRLSELIMRHSRSLGVRRCDTTRVCMQRETHTVTLPPDSPYPGESITVKTCTYNDMAFTKPEYDSLVALARAFKEPVTEVRQRLCAFFSSHHPVTPSEDT